MRIASTSSQHRLPGIDLLRAVAVILMFTTHLRRLQEMSGVKEDPWPLLRATLDFLMLIEPFTLALFLFVAGFSTVLAHDSGQSAGFRASLSRIGKRVLYLIAISSVLFVFEWGPQWPEVIVSSGPLLVIGISILCVHLCISCPKPLIALGFSSLMVLAATYGLNLTKSYIAGINIGNGGLIPSVVFAIYGGAAAIAVRLQTQKAKLTFLALILLTAIAGFTLSGPWRTVQTLHFTRYGREPHLVAWISGYFSGMLPTPIHIGFWHYTFAASLRMALPLFVALAVALGASNWQHRALKPILFLGRNALNAYVFHSVVLGLLYFFRAFPRNSAATFGYVVALSVVTTLAIKLLEHHRTLAQAHTAKHTSINDNGAAGSQQKAA